MVWPTRQRNRVTGRSSLTGVWFLPLNSGRTGHRTMWFLAMRGVDWGMASSVLAGGLDQGSFE
jgi:hypothetical protein